MKGDPLTTQRFHLPRRQRGSSLFAAFLLVLSSFLRPFDLCAAPMVSLQAQVFLASNQPGVAPDPSLVDLIAKLKTALPYSSFQLWGTPSGRTGLGQSWTTELPGGETPRGRTLELTPTAIEQGTVQLQARIVQARTVQGKSITETLVNTILRLQSGGNVVIGGPAYQSGVLVIVIYASAP
jgi:hypothetical protein